MRTVDDLLEELVNSIKTGSVFMDGSSYGSIQLRAGLRGEIDDFLNRKDKLVVGSEWVCEATNENDDVIFHEGDVIIVKQVDDTMINIINNNFNEFDMGWIYKDQFLACFTPKEKAND